MKSLEKIRDELAEIWISNEVSKGSSLAIYRDAQEVYKAGFDAAVAHMQSPSIVDGDVSLEPEIYLDPKNHKLPIVPGFDKKAAKDKGAELAMKFGEKFQASANEVFNIQIVSFEDGARWQFNQMQAEIERLKAELEKWKSDYPFNLHKVVSTLEVKEAQLAKLAEASKAVTAWINLDALDKSHPILKLAEALTSINGGENE